MPAGTKIIKSRIKSIGNTKKVTKAMEMVSGAKMRRSVSAVLATRPYASTAWELVFRLAKTEKNKHPLLAVREKVSHTVIVLITSNRGLCGSFNEKVINKALSVYIEEEKNNQASFVVMGDKGVRAISRRELKLEAVFDKPDVSAGINDIIPLALFLKDGFLEKNFDKVILVYTDYKSALSQEVKIKQILPISLVEDNQLGFVGENKEKEKSENIQNPLFEPSRSSVLDYLLPRVIETEIYQALLESNAGEHSSRMLSMKNASEAASDMISELTLIFNRARQAYITQEIAEISGGKAALESK